MFTQKPPILWVAFDVAAPLDALDEARGAAEGPVSQFCWTDGP